MFTGSYMNIMGENNFVPLQLFYKGIFKQTMCNKNKIFHIKFQNEAIIKFTSKKIISSSY